MPSRDPEVVEDPDTPIEDVRLIGGGPLDGVHMKVAPEAFKVTAASRDGKLMAIYDRDGESSKFVFQGFEDNDWDN